MMRRWPALLMLGVLTTMSGCGAETGSGGSAPASGGGSGSATSVDPTASTPAPPPEPSGIPAPIVAGEVTLTLDAGGYTVGQKIRVTVHNGNDRPAYTEDFKTACSILFLQRKGNGGWTDITGCALGRPTMTVKLEPGSTDPIELDPSSFHLRSGPAVTAGSYRVKLTYRTEPESTGTDPFTAYSPEFPVR
jgi:hypothetical protein